MTDRESTGLVLKNYSGYYYVQVPGGTIYECKIRGKLKEKVVSGDWVRFTVIDETTGILEDIEERSSLLNRPRIANVTMVLIVIAADKPAPSLLLLDRLLLLASINNIKPCIIVNKSDLPADEKTLWAKEYYPRAGFPLIQISALRNENIDKVRSILESQIAVLAGPSGVGKSSLLNALTGCESIKTGEISDRIGRGKHTTRHVELFAIGNSGWLADTPGFSVLDIPDIKRNELASFYPDFHDPSQDCRFDDCLHNRESECGVKTAVQNGVISQFRYNNYLHLLEEVIEKERCYR